MQNRFPLHNLPWVLTRDPDENAGPDWEDSIPASVPGNIVADLFRAGLLPDPYYGENFRSCKWTEEWTFWYKTEFAFADLGLEDAEDGDRFQLQFEGIDTFADIYLNDTPIVSVHNMFRRYGPDVTSLLRREGLNTLAVRIKPPVESAYKWAEERKLDVHSLDNPVFGYKERLYTRKAQMSYGWDQTPSLLTGGIFRPVYLSRRRGQCLENCRWSVTELDAERRTAVLTIAGDISGAEGGFVKVQGQCGESRFSGSMPVDGQSFSIRIEVKEARLWWPRGAGEPHLYAVSIVLLDPQERVADEERLEIGIRTVEVRTSPAEKRLVDYRIGLQKEKEGMDGGTLGPWERVELEEPEEVEVRPFTLVVNGRKLFIKGFDWQNTEALFGCEDPDKVKALLDGVQRTNANMLRLWGGGAVETDLFYEECARRGLMVWQDFYFACGRYPMEESFLEEIRGEAVDIIRRLRNHTCVSLWCGDNESDKIDYDENADPAGNLINKRVLPEALRRHDPQGRHYHPSSPSGGTTPYSDWGGDKRNWGAWYPHANYRHIRQESARIISEGGSYVLPDLESIDKFMPPQVRWPLNTRTWRLHHGEVDRTPRKLWAATMNAMSYFAEARNLEEAVEISQFAHAWGNKLLAERCRQQKYECGGVLLWKFNACWPCADGMMMDYYLKPTLAFAFIAEAYKPVAVSLTQHYRDPDADLELYVVNDAAEETRGRLTCIAASLDARGLPGLQEVLFDEQVTAAPDSSMNRFQHSIVGVPRDRVVYLAKFTGEDGRTAVGAYSLEPRAAYLFFRSLNFDLAGTERFFPQTSLVK